MMMKGFWNTSTNSMMRREHYTAYKLLAPTLFVLFLVAMAQFSGEFSQQIPFGEIMAGGVVSTIPLILLVVIFQKKIIAGLTAGAVKG